jgi:hypothetical protein
MLHNTITAPNCVTADASRERLELAHNAGALEMGIDAAETIQAANSLEKMLAHQMAAIHGATMRMTEQLNRCIERMAPENMPLMTAKPDARVPTSKRLVLPVRSLG